MTPLECRKAFTPGPHPLASDQLLKGYAMDKREISEDLIRRARRRRFLPLIFHWLLRPLGYLELTDVYKIDLADLPPLFEIAGYTIERANAADIADIVQNIKRDEPSSVISTLWEQGHHCFVAKSDGRVVAYNWISFAEVQEEEYRYTPRDDHAICVNAYTIPKHRGKLLHLLLLLTMLHFAFASGKKLAYTGVSLLNMVSWKTHLRIGWVLDFTFCWFRPNFTFRRQPWRLSREQYPLQLDWDNHAWFATKNP